MLFRASTVTAILSLLSLSTALPATPLSSTLYTRDDTQCQAGTAFYVCHINNFRGCCSVDPCALESGCPDTKTTPPTCTDGKAQIYQPTMQTLISGAEPVSTPNFNVSKSATKTWAQSMTFEVPKDAKACELKWSVPAERNFMAGNNALVRVFDRQKSLGAADFTNWPGVTGEHHHNVASVECKEELTFRLKLDNESEVFIDQSEEAGWYIQYSC
ncbi:hypothetical protein BDV29DRAFT_179764 [Aspergillus leporis]|jgi:hypothetical protein|uniref:Ubiquitin 3 binding protein But2 C-terminal domain-containing protein n=1 Tax=Aspergillus leporis TaxID=41062 RepID=A0A5N5WRG2_9EURO|nr:hypothetical protein BDV29DRAFT_179764 [Aspergillus leporis]